MYSKGMYHLSNGMFYDVVYGDMRRGEAPYKVIEYKDVFDGLFISETGNVEMCDNFTEVREFLIEMNGGEEIWC